MTTWLLGLALKATLLLLSLALAGAAVRRSPAATRHFVWLGGLAALLALPVLVTVTPSWSPGWAAAWLPEYLLADAVDAEERPLPQESFAPTGVADMMLRAPLAQQLTSVSVGSRAAGIPEGPRLAEQSFAGVLSSTMSFWLAFVWAAGVLAMLCRLAVGFVRRAHLARRATAVEAGPMVDAGELAARALSVRYRVRLLLGDSAVVPMTWGVVRPVLFLPAAAENWSARRLNTVLLHELAHIKRRDSLSRSLAQLACSVFWFHPLAWLSAARMLREQERACDDVVILAGADPHHYAETLVAIAREFRSPRPSVVGALAFARRSNLEHRLLSILDPLERRKKLSHSRKAMVLVLFAALALPLAALHPAASAQVPDAGLQAAQKSKARPKGVVVRRPDASGAQVGVVVPQADASPQVGVAVRAEAPNPQVSVVRKDAPNPQVSVVVPRAESAPQVGVAVLGEAASRPQVSVVAPRADSAAPQVGAAVPRADAAAPQAAVRALRAGDSSVGIGAAPRADVSTTSSGIAAPRAGVSAAGTGVVAPRAIAGSAGVGVVAPRLGGSAPQTGTVWTERRSIQIQLQAEGAIRIADNVEEVELEDGGWLALTEGDRRLEIRPSGSGDLDYVYTVDGAEVVFDDDAREWANEILEQVAGMGTMRGNIFISTSHGEAGGELSSVVLEPLELSIEGLDLAMEPLAVTIEGLDMAMEPLAVTIEGLDLAMEPLAVSIAELDLAGEPLALTLDHLELAQEPLRVTVETLDLAGESLALTLDHLEMAQEPLRVTVETLDLAGEPLALTLDHLELTQEPLRVTVEALKALPESLVLSVEPIELAAEPLALSIEPLELALEMPLLEDIRERRFDRVLTWSEDGSRFVAMWRGEVDLGESIDEIDVGEGGNLVIDGRGADGVHRRLHVSADESGEPTFEWFIDGEAAAFDAGGRAWLQPVLDWLSKNAG